MLRHVLLCTDEKKNVAITSVATAMAWLAGQGLSASLHLTFVCCVLSKAKKELVNVFRESAFLSGVHTLITPKRELFHPHFGNRRLYKYIYIYIYI